MRRSPPDCWQAHAVAPSEPPARGFFREARQEQLEPQVLVPVDEFEDRAFEPREPRRRQQIAERCDIARPHFDVEEAGGLESRCLLSWRHCRIEAVFAVDLVIKRALGRRKPQLRVQSRRLFPDGGRAPPAEFAEPRLRSEEIVLGGDDVQEPFREIAENVQK